MKVYLIEEVWPSESFVVGVRLYKDEAISEARAWLTHHHDVAVTEHDTQDAIEVKSDVIVWRSGIVS